MDPVTIILAVGLVLAAWAAPVAVYVVVRHLHVGGTTENLAERQIALQELKAKNEQDLAERKLAMDEQRFHLDLAGAKAKQEALQAARVNVRNVER